MARRTWGAGSDHGRDVVSVRDVLEGEAAQRLWAIADMGPLVSVSRSRDGGAVGVTITLDGVPEREWFRSSADAILKFDEWAGVIEDELREGAASSERRSRPRRAR